MANNIWRPTSPSALTRRDVLAGSAALLAPLSIVGATPAKATGAKGAVTLAWHTGMAPRWLDPQEHDGTATPDNFLMALHDALIKNSGDGCTIIRRWRSSFEFAKDAKSGTFRLRPGIKFHNGEPVTPEDVKFSYENYRGALAGVLQGEDRRAWRSSIAARSDSTSTSRSWISRCCSAPSNVCGAGWIVPAKYYQQVGPDVFKQQADRRRSLQDGQPGSRREDRDGGVRRLLPAGAHQEIHDDLGAGSGDADGDAGTRRGGHHLFCSR